MRSTVMSYSQVGHTEFPLPKLFSKYYVNLKIIWLRTAKFHMRISFYASSLINTSVCFKIRHTNGQTVLTFPVVADGRMQKVWSLPDRWLHLERTASEGVAQRMPMTTVSSPATCFSVYNFQIQQIHVSKFAAGKRTFRPTLAAQLRLGIGTNKCLSAKV